MVLAQDDTTSSSAKLLELIRAPKAPERPDAVAPATGVSSGGLAAHGASSNGVPSNGPSVQGGAANGARGSNGSRSFGGSLFGGRGRHSIGVDIGRDAIRMVKIRKKDVGFELLAHESIPIPPGLDPESEPYVALLRAAVTDFSGNGKAPEIWSAVHTERADMTLLTIPKLPRSQVDNAVYWTAKKELAFEDRNVIFDFEYRGPVTEKGAERLAAFVMAVPREDVKARQDMFTRAGVTLTGLMPPPFAVQNVFRKKCLATPDGAWGNLHVGANWSRIDIYRQGDLVFTRVVKTAMAGMEQILQDRLKDRLASRDKAKEAATAPAEASAPVGAGLPLTLEPSTEAKPPELVLTLFDDAPSLVAPSPGPATSSETGEPVLTMGPIGFVGQDGSAGQAGPAVVEASPAARPASPSRPSPDQVGEELVRSLLKSLNQGCATSEDCGVGFMMTSEELIDLLDPAVSRLARQVEMTLKHFRETLGNESVVRLYVSGGLSGSPLFVATLGERLGLPCEVFDPLGARGLRGLVSPESALMPLHERTELAPALGLALSTSAMTPNLLHTYKEKGEERRKALVDRGVILATVAALGVLGGVYAWQRLEAGRLMTTRDALKTEMERFGPTLDLARLAGEAAKAKSTQESVKAYARRNIGLAAISEITTLSPSNLKILSLTLDLGVPGTNGGQGPATPAPKPGAPVTPKTQAKPLAGAQNQARLLKKATIDGIITGDRMMYESVLSGYLVGLQNSPLFSDASVTMRQVETGEAGEDVFRFVMTLVLAEE